MYADKVKKEKNFFKALNEGYNPVEEKRNLVTKYYTFDDVEKKSNLVTKHYTFDDMYSVERVLDSYLSDLQGNFKKESTYDAVRIYRMLIFVYKGMEEIAKTYIKGNQKVITPDNRIFFKYIANGEYKRIINVLEIKHGIFNDIETKSGREVEETKFEHSWRITEEIEERIKKAYDAYNEEESKASANDEKDIKKYAKTMKKMLSTTFVPRYSVNTKSYELVYDKEFYKKLEEENKDGKIDKYINNAIFMNLLSSEERIKLIRTYKVMLKRNEKNEKEDETYIIKLPKEATEQQKDDETNPPEAITFDPAYKNKKNVTYIKSGIIKNSEGNFTLHKIGKPTTESDKPKDKPVFEAHSASNGTGAKSEITHCFIRFRATEYDPDETSNSNTDEISKHSPYKRKVYSLGFYPAHYGGNERFSMVKETSLFRSITNRVMGQKSERGLIKDDSKHYSQIAITRKCDNKKISQLDKCIHNFADKERYNLALNNCTAFVSKMSKDIGYKDISSLFKSFVLYAPNLAAGKLVNAMMSDKYKKDENTSFKTEDFVNRLYDNVNYNENDNDIRKQFNSYKENLIKNQGKDFFSKESSHGILYEMMHKKDIDYASTYTDIEKEDTAGLGEKAYEAFCNTYEIYIKPFYGLSKTDSKNEQEISEVFDKAKNNFRNLTENKKNFENSPTQEVEEKSKKYFKSLEDTQKAMENLRKIALKHKNIRAFLMANCFVDRIGDEMKSHH